MKHLTLILILSLAAAIPGYAAKYRTFKDAQGREMQAKINRVSGEDVYIERRDGLTTRVNISIFSQEDQDYIREWEQKNFLKSGVVEVRFAEEETGESKSTMGGIISKSYNANYEIILKNNGDRDVKDLKVEYLILKFTDQVAAKKRSEGQIERQKGTIELTKLASRSESRLPTKTFSMMETELKPNYVWAGDAGQARESKDKLEGIWVKVYSGDMLILEDSRPQSMMRKEPW